MLVSVLVGAFAAATILDLYLRKKFNIEKNEKFLDQFLSKGHMVFEILLCIVFLTTISVNAITGKQLYILLFLFFATLYAIRALLERLLQRDKKKYIISLAYVTICLIVVIGIVIFL